MMSPPERSLSAEQRERKKKNRDKREAGDDPQSEPPSFEKANSSRGGRSSVDSTPFLKKSGLSKESSFETPSKAAPDFEAVAEIIGAQNLDTSDIKAIIQSHDVSDLEQCPRKDIKNSSDSEPEAPAPRTCTPKKRYT
ncbi:hypothetical protein ONE63_003493 [Megalurothrips usitatus]|uniref:Uncharacterized protein n=1 Tax=Megalurothrips usitatus TaxID=439358 RepID=A0AAV7X7G7_9NEOP|nr:hypothetical protein ONE63_003493 [Megalurothrips usitatus]